MNTVDWSRALAGIPLGLLLVPLVLHPLALVAARLVRGRSAPPPRAKRRARAGLDVLLAEFAATGGTPSRAPEPPGPSAAAP